jgi:antitoxin Phd
MEIMKTSANEKPTKSTLTLHEAMKLVLSDVEGNQMHAADLADEIYRRGLYLKKDGARRNITK